MAAQEAIKGNKHEYGHPLQYASKALRRDRQLVLVGLAPACWWAIIVTDKVADIIRHGKHTFELEYYLSEYNNNKPAMS